MVGPGIHVEDAYVTEQKPGTIIGLPVLTAVDHVTLQLVHLTRHDGQLLQKTVAHGPMQCVTLLGSQGLPIAARSLEALARLPARPSHPMVASVQVLSGLGRGHDDGDPMHSHSSVRMGRVPTCVTVSCSLFLLFLCLRLHVLVPRRIRTSCQHRVDEWLALACLSMVAKLRKPGGGPGDPYWSGLALHRCTTWPARLRSSCSVAQHHRWPAPGCWAFS